MDTQTMLIVASLSGLVLIIVFALFLSRRRKENFDRRVNATITNIQMEASNVSSWWRITAEWSDPQTGRKFVFRSPHINRPPRQRIGKPIVVSFDGSKPTHYHMELE